MNKDNNKKNFSIKLDSHNLGLLSLLFLFVSVSSCAIFMFMNNVDNYVDMMKANVSDVGGGTDLAIKRPVIDSRENPFTDLDITQDYSKAVLELYHLGINSGYQDGTYRAEDTINRAEFSKMLAEASDLDYSDFDSSGLANCFSDVNDLPEDWYAPPVCAFMRQGVVKGYDNGTFGPGKDITKIESYKIVLNVFGFDIPNNEDVEVLPYADMNFNVWYLGVAEAVKNHGLALDGMVLNPNDKIRRGEVATLIYNAMTLKDLL